MTGRRRVVLLFGSGSEAERSAALSSESSRLGSVLREAGDEVEVAVVSLGLSRTIPGVSEHLRLDEAPRSRVDRVLGALGALTLRRLLAAFPLGRLLNTLGPVDPGRVFWRAVRRHPGARGLLRSADVVIAADPAAIKTAWLALRRGWTTEAHYDHRSASVGISWQLPGAPRA